MLVGCNNAQSPIPSTNTETSSSPAPSEQYPTVAPQEKDYVYGTITDKISPNMLVLNIELKLLADKYGQTVHIVTDDIDKWQLGTKIEVHFNKLERPQDSSGNIRIIADNILLYSPVDKPVIYLYPEDTTVCSVKVELNGSLTCTYPEHGDNGWQNFTAHPNGTLVFPDGKQYYALYWEGIQNTQWDFTKGFCVRGTDTAKFLEWALEKQGLTQREANEFIIYWLPLMQNNPYNVISFQAESYTDGAILNITPSPDSVLRVFMAYYPSDVAVDIPPQDLQSTPRQGFTVVEWGGSCTNKSK